MKMESVERTELAYRKTRRVYEEEDGSRTNFEAEVVKCRIDGEGEKVLYSYEFSGDLQFKECIVTEDILDLTELLEDAILEYFWEENEYFKEYLQGHELTCFYSHDFEGLNEKQKENGMKLTEQKIAELAEAVANSTALEHEKDSAEETKKWLAETKEQAEKIICANTFEYEAMCESEIIQDVVEEILEG